MYADGENNLSDGEVMCIHQTKDQKLNPLKKYGMPGK
jgi:hypothetical protein